MKSDDEAHLCPVRALADWLSVSRITSGFLFRPITSNDRVSANNMPLVSLPASVPPPWPVQNSELYYSQTSDKFLEMFRNNLCDIFQDPLVYGTHSFRRGGCQWYATEKRWPLRRICDWGGWSMELTNLTIVRYLISSNDNPLERREQYLDPTVRPVVKCNHCGRSCAYA